MIIDTAVRIALWHDGTEVDALVAQSPEGAVELTVEMLRRHKRLLAGDTLMVERLAGFLERRRDLWRKGAQTEARGRP